MDLQLAAVHDGVERPFAGVVEAPVAGLENELGEGVLTEQLRELEAASRRPVVARIVQRNEGEDAVRADCQMAHEIWDQRHPWSGGQLGDAEVYLGLRHLARAV